MIMDDSHFKDWIESASQEEKKLYDRIYDFGDYFGDMLFEEDSSTGGMIKCQSGVGDDGCQDDIVPLPDTFKCFSYNFFKLKVEPIKDYGGFFDEKEQLLCISTENLDNDSAILHEMIHLHEFVVNEQPMFYHDTLLWALYTDLKSKIYGLDKAMSSCAQIMRGQSIYNKGGVHDILFLLKSMDLDIRMRYQLGTVYGYRAKEQLSGLKYKI